MALKIKNNNEDNYQKYNLLQYNIPGLSPGVPALPALYNIGINQKAPNIPPVDMPEMHMPRALNYYADHGGCGFWRMGWSEYLLKIKQKADITGLTAMVLNENFYQHIKCIRMQRQATESQKAFIHSLKQLALKYKYKIIYEVDDIVFKNDIPDYNRCKEAFDSPQIEQNILEIMSLTDEFTVTCDYMKEYYSGKTKHSKITVLPNYAPKFWLDGFYNKEELVRRFEKHKKRPRVLYSGSGVHTDIVNKTNQKDDFEHVVGDIIKARRDFKFVWKGCFPLACKPFIDNGEMEFLPWDDLSNYPKGLYETNANITFASLQDNVFNKSKSNIKMIESGGLGMPGVFQDMCTYSNAELKFKTGSDLIDQLKYATSNIDTYINLSNNLRKFTESMWLEDHLDEVMAIYFTEWGSRERNIMSSTLIKNNPDQKIKH